MKINIGAVAFLNGVVLCCLAVVMCVPLFYDVAFCASQNIKLFLVAIAVCMFFGLCSVLAYKRKLNALSIQDMYLTTTCFWIVVSLFSAIPFYLYNFEKSDFIFAFLSAFFESTSGITTTGATIYQDVETLPQSLMLWRFILHLIGGAGIVAIALLVSPMLRVGGLHLFQTENSDKSEKFALRVTQTASFFVFTYFAIIFITTLLLANADLSWFDAFCHSVSAISTGGFSTKNIGVSAFNNKYAELILMFAMLIGGLAFVEIMYSLKKGFKNFFTDNQTKIYVKLILFTVILITLYQIFIGCFSINSIISIVFDIISSITTAGLNLNNNYHSAPFLLIVMIILLTTGGCSGSTTGGIKLFRVRIMYLAIKNYIKPILQPFSVQKNEYNKITLQPVFMSVFVFLTLLLFTFIFSSIIISLFSNYSLNIIFAAVFSCLFNAGFDIYFLTAENIAFCDLNTISQLVLIIDMIMGRLELLPIFIAITSIKTSK